MRIDGKRASAFKSMELYIMLVTHQSMNGYNLTEEQLREIGKVIQKRAIQKQMKGRVHYGT